MSVVLTTLFSIVSLALLAACSPNKTAIPSGGSDVIASGKVVYDESCAVCHYGGEGSPVAPPLRGSPILVGDPGALLRTILHGQKGVSVVGGKKFNGIMPGVPSLSDADAAAVATYIRKEFAGIDQPVSPDVAAAQR